MKIAICDDEQSDLIRIHSYCQKYDGSIPVQLFSSGAHLLEAFRADFFDLVFLDIEMAAPNGLAVGAELIRNNPKPVIIFTTQSLNYAVRGYGIAMRYLPKPIDYDTFSGVMRLAMEKILPHKISVTRNGEQLIIPVSDISYFEVIRHQVIFHLETQETITVRGSLADVMNQLSRNWFAQPHKSFCVNMDHIDRVSRQAITMTNGETVPIGRNKSDFFQKQLDEYLKGSHAI